VKEIPLTKGFTATVDDADFDSIGGHRWCALVGKRADGSLRVYAARRKPKAEGGKFELLHRRLMQPAHGQEVDHIDGNPLNNTRGNMRFASHRENLLNMRARTAEQSSSAFKGVSWYRKDKRWAAKIMAHGRTRHLGMFKDEQQAARAYDAAAMEMFGEFAKLNFTEGN